MFLRRGKPSCLPALRIHTQARPYHAYQVEKLGIGVMGEWGVGVEVFSPQYPNAVFRCDSVSDLMYQSFLATA